jgi:hypothetical protein
MGEYSIATMAANTGQLSTGGSAAILTLNPTVINSKTPTLLLKLRTTGAVAGINYDQLMMSTASNTNFNGTTLSVTDNTNDPIGTVYTLVSSASGSITGPFASITLPFTLGNLTYNSNSITIEKVIPVPLPLTWGSFTVAEQNSHVYLNWTTLQEINTSRFIVEKSVDGSTFTAIGEVSAAGNSTATTGYTFIDFHPAAGNVNYYRLKQIDINNRYTYSSIRSLKTSAEYLSILKGIVNPFKDQFRMFTTSKDFSFSISDLSGKLMCKGMLVPGSNTIDCQKWSRGVYQVSVFVKGRLTEVRQFLKL